jgi:hypothetical protein
MADVIEEKVKHIVLRVQQSALSNDVKASLYETMQRGIRDVAMGALISHMPQEKLDELVAHPESITPDALVGLMESSVGDGEVLREAQQKILTALETIETVLTKQHVA